MPPDFGVRFCFRVATTINVETKTIYSFSSDYMHGLVIHSDYEESTVRKL